MIIPLCLQGETDPFEQAVRAGEIELEVVPMGTLAERYRAAAAGGGCRLSPYRHRSIVEKSVVSSIVANRTPKKTRVSTAEHTY